MKRERKLYLVPQTTMTQVQIEGTFAASLENDAQLAPDAVTFEVEEYASIENDVAFQ